jgi:hypothetical protein
MDDMRRLHIADCTNMPGDITFRLIKEGEERVLKHPDDYSLGDCENCDRERCDDCNRIMSDDYATMQEIVCDDCDYISPEEVDIKEREARDSERGSIRFMIQVGSPPADILEAIKCHYVPKDIQGQMKLTDLKGGENGDRV